MPKLYRSHPVVGRRRAFTLLEASMASTILFLIVVAVTSAVTAAQQNAFEAKLQIAAALAAEDLMGRLIGVAYEDLPKLHNSTENPGELTDVHGDPMPPSINLVGRTVLVSTLMTSLTDAGIKIRGRLVQVRSFDDRGRTLIELTRFVPEPQELP